MNNIVTSVITAPLRTPQPNEKYYMSDVPRLNPEEKEFWLTNLADPSYTQGHGMLEVIDSEDPSISKFCCLGVYCRAKKVPRIVQEIDMYGTGDDVVKTAVYGDIELGEVFMPDSGNQVEHEDRAWSWGLIPTKYAIPYADPTFNDGKDHEQPAFTGDNDIFSCRAQGPRDRVAYLDPAFIAYRENYTLPQLNDSGEFTFAQIADIINYFL